MTNDKTSAVRQANREWEVSDFYGDREMANWARAWGVDLLEAATTGQPTQSDALREAVEAERERCAQIAENIIGANQYDTMDTDCYQDTADRIAAAIRNNSPMPYGEAVAYLLKHGKKWEQLK